MEGGRERRPVLDGRVAGVLRLLLGLGVWVLGFKGVGLGGGLVGMIHNSQGGAREESAEMQHPHTHTHPSHKPSHQKDQQRTTDLDLLKLGQLHNARVHALVGRAEVAEDAVQLVALGGACEEGPAVGHLCMLGFWVGCGGWKGVWCGPSLLLGFWGFGLGGLGLVVVVCGS